jgi:hypothetical protein
LGTFLTEPTAVPPHVVNLSIGCTNLRRHTHNIVLSRPSYRDAGAAVADETCPRTICRSLTALALSGAYIQATTLPHASHGPRRALVELSLCECCTVRATALACCRRVSRLLCLARS